MRPYQSGAGQRVLVLNLLVRAEGEQLQRGLTTEASLTGPCRLRPRPCSCSSGSRKADQHQRLVPGLGNQRLAMGCGLVTSRSLRRAQARLRGLYTISAQLIGTECRRLLWAPPVKVGKHCQRLHWAKCSTHALPLTVFIGQSVRAESARCAAARHRSWPSRIDDGQRAARLMRRDRFVETDVAIRSVAIAWPDACKPRPAAVAGS